MVSIGELVGRISTGARGSVAAARTIARVARRKDEKVDIGRTTKAILRFKRPVVVIRRLPRLGPPPIPPKRLKVRRQVKRLSREEITKLNRLLLKQKRPILGPPPRRPIKKRKIVKKKRKK